MQPQKQLLRLSSDAGTSPCCSAVFLIPFISIASPRPLPPAPPSFVYDEAKALEPETVEALQRLFKAQERVTGDQVVFAVFKSLGGEDLVSWTNRVFHAWKIGKKGKDNGVLLAVYWSDHKARMEVGYGFESKLTDAKSKRILEEFLSPNLKINLPDRALTQTALEVLTVLESPLIQNGEAVAILRGAHISHAAAPPPIHSAGHFVWLVLSFFLILIFGRAFFYRGDRKFERSQWHPSNPLGFRRRRGGAPPINSDFGGFGGGPGGTFGGGGGSSDNNDFGGGGGDSGGGGANQDW